MLQQFVALAGGQLRFQTVKLLFQRAAVFHQLRDALGSLGRGGLDQLRDCAEVLFGFAEVGEYTRASSCLDATNTCRDAGFKQDLEGADVAGAGDMGAAAQFARAADVEHPHFVAVFLAEQHHRAGLLRGLDRHHPCLGGSIGEDLGVDARFDLADLCRGHRGGLDEVEAGFLAVDQ